MYNLPCVLFRCTDLNGLGSHRSPWIRDSNKWQQSPLTSCAEGLFDSQLSASQSYHHSSPIWERPYNQTEHRPPPTHIPLMSPETRYGREHLRHTACSSPISSPVVFLCALCSIPGSGPSVIGLVPPEGVQSSRDPPLNKSKGTNEPLFKKWHYPW